jgi:hypothetical protein
MIGEVDNKEDIHLKVLSLGSPNQKLTFSNGIKSKALKNLNEKSKWCNGKVMLEFIIWFNTQELSIYSMFQNQIQ